MTITLCLKILSKGFIVLFSRTYYSIYKKHVSPKTSINFCVSVPVVNWSYKAFLRSCSLLSCCSFLPYFGWQMPFSSLPGSSSLSWSPGDWNNQLKVQTYVIILFLRTVYYSAEVSHLGVHLVSFLIGSMILCPIIFICLSNYGIPECKSLLVPNWWCNIPAMCLFSLPCHFSTE